MAGFVLRQFTMALASILHNLLWVYSVIVFVTVLLSWVNPDPRNPIVRFLYGVTEPVLYRIRRRLPFVVAAGFDFSPLLLLVGIQLVDRVVVPSLFELALRMGG
jgi:YggT family protein